MAYHGKSFIQDVPPGNKPSQTLTLFSYQGGLDNVSSQQNIGNESCTDILNMMFLEDGLIQKRFGTHPYNTTVYDGTVTYIDEFESDEGRKLVIGTNTSLYIDGVKVRTLVGKPEGISVANKYLFIDGHNLYSYEKAESGTWKVYKIVEPVVVKDALAEKATKGSKMIVVKDVSKFSVGDWIQLGERKIDDKGKQTDTPPPFTAKILSIRGNALTLGTEKNIDEIQTTTSTNDTGSGSSKVLSEANTGTDKSVSTNKKLEGKWFEDGKFQTDTVSSRSSGTASQTTEETHTGVTVTTTTTTYTGKDVTEPEYTRLEYDYPANTPVILMPSHDLYQYSGEWKTDEKKNEKWYEPCMHELKHAFFGLNVPAPKPTHICYNKNRVIISGGDEESHIIYMSETNNPYYFPVSTGLAVPDTGESVSKLVSFHDSVVVCRESDIYTIYGSSNNPEFGDVFTMKRITTHAGVVAGDTVQVVHNYLFYLGTDGVVYRMNTTNTDVRLLTTHVVSQRINLFTHPLSLTLEQMKQAMATFTADNYYLSIGNIVLVYSYRFMAWSKFDRLECTSLYRIDEEIVWGKKNRLYCFNHDNFLDDNIEFNCYWESKLFDLNLPVNYKYFKYISLVFETYEHFDSTARLLFEIDYEDVKLDYIFKNAIARWGVAKWGDRFATRNISKSLPIYVGRRGRLMKVKVHNGYFIQYKVDTVAHMQALKPKIDETCYVKTDATNGNHSHYVYKMIVDDKGRQSLEWVLIPREETNQPIKLYNIEIEYSVRGRR